MNFFGLVSFEEDLNCFTLIYKDKKYILESREVKKALLSSCGGNYNEAFFRLYEKTALHEVVELLDIFVEFQKHQQKLMEQQNNRKNGIFSKEIQF